MNAMYYLSVLKSKLFFVVLQPLILFCMGDTVIYLVVFFIGGPIRSP